jgi:ketosteroid isomerase-like protein
MSRENEELARRAYDAFNRGDWDAFVDLLDPGVEFTSLLLEAEGGTYRGHEGAREYFESLRGVFGDWRSEIVEMRDFGETLVIQSRGVGTGGASGVELEQEFWQAARVSNGKIVWWKFCRTEAEAIEAAGPREGDSLKQD